MKRNNLDGNSLARVAALTTLFALAACSKLSHVGDNNEPAPRAVATAIGESFTRDSNGNLQATVRAGSEVVLTGKDSEKGDNDSGVPLVNFKWEQQSPGSNTVQLISRTSNTVSFTAPQVTASTQLTFKLTVSDVKGNTASTQALITVLPVRDQDHFLQYLSVGNTIPVVLATQSAIAADSSASATATLPVTVTITKLVTFPDRNDSSVTHTRIPVGTPVTINTGWSTQLGSSASCSGNQNPIVQVPVPRLNLDDLLPSGAFADAVILSDVLEPSDIDQATLEVRIDVSSGNSTVTASVPVACVNGSSTASASGSVFTHESLLAGITPRDTKTSAQAYYATIDPSNDKNTLNKWLDANGFNSSVSGWNADAHAIYTNNYDLGFGRDMYMKIGGATGKCDNGTAALPLAVSNVGKCDIAAVVVNYSGVEAAAKKLNPVVAVAMEYSAPPGGGARIVKFYTFTPDTRTGEYMRVSSVNLDRRGEQFMPQACVVCHGGTPGSVDGNGKYNTNGDVQAGFLPWDLDSLLYSDTDPGFSAKSKDAALRTQYTRSAQEAQFKLLNTGAYLTLSDPAAVPGRYALARELVEGWYHGSSTTGLTATSYDGSFVPAGWKATGVDGVANTADDNPANSASLYSDVFARSCRMCHTLQVPATATPESSASCASTATVANTANQVAMGCYWQFANAPFLTQVLSQGRMPLARRTMDRLWAGTAQWTNSAGASQQGTRGEELFDNLRAAFNATNRTAQANGLVTPGSPQLSIQVTPSSNSDVLDWVSFATTDGLSDSSFGFLTQPMWNVCVSSSTTCAGASSVFAVVGSSNPSAHFQVPRSGSLLVELISGSQSVATASISVASKSPSINTLPTQVQRQGTISLQGNSLVNPGNGPTGDALSAHKWWISDLQNLSFASGSPVCVASTPCTVKDSTIVLTETDALATSGSYTVNVTDADGTPATTAATSVTIVSGLVVNSLTGRVTANANEASVTRDDNSGIALNLLQSNTAQSGATLAVQICAGTSASSCSSTASAACTTSDTTSSGCATTGANYAGVAGKAFLSGTQLQYTPPATYATHSPSGLDTTNPATKAADQLYYRVVEMSGSTALDYSNWALLKIKVLAHKSFPTDIVQNIFQRSSAYPSGGSACTGCHFNDSGYSSLPNNALMFASYDGASITNLSAAQIYNLLVPTPIGANGKSTTAVVQGPSQSRPYIDLTNPTGDSVLYMHPHNTDGYVGGHTGSDRCPGGLGSLTCDLTDVITWIQDGANPF